MTNTTYQKFVKRWEEVTDLPPQTVGPLTPYYKALVRRIKVMPWPVMVICSLLSVVGLYLLIGSAITLVVSILQRGF
jgi:hypothetical protein